MKRARKGFTSRAAAPPGWAVAAHDDSNFQGVTATSSGRGPRRAPSRKRVSATGVIVTLSPRDYDAVPFDLDGVLTRTASVHAEAWKTLSRRSTRLRRCPGRERRRLPYARRRPACAVSLDTVRNRTPQRLESPLASRLHSQAFDFRTFPGAARLMHEQPLGKAPHAADAGMEGRNEATAWAVLPTAQRASDARVHRRSPTQDRSGDRLLRRSPSWRRARHTLGGDDPAGGGLP